MSGTWIVCGLLAAATAAAVAVLVRTRWLQSHTLRKCVALSLALHALAAVVCALVAGRSPASWGLHEAGRMTMTIVLADDPAAEDAPPDGGPTDAVFDEFSPADTPEPRDVAKLAAPAAEPPADMADMVPLLEVAQTAPAADAHESEEPVQEPAPADDLAAAGPDDVPAEGLREPAADAAIAGARSPRRADAEAASIAAAEAAAAPRLPGAYPDVYADRAGARRTAAAAARGGSFETERAVQAALAWLAAAQAENGRWDAARHGAGVERSVEGHHRQGVGARSDHGVTGLALLAFLGAGNTHKHGEHAETVARGLRFLVARQRADGSLAGDAEFFAALYCHGMAGIALAECCAMTGDAALRQPLERAVRHTVSMQSPATGGWRYAAGDKGDTSQLGWQVMLLASARHAGLSGFEAAEARAAAFVRSVSSGRAGGLAAYRAGERPSLAMTAEALASRMFLGLPVDPAGVAEAVDFVARTPPDPRSPNAYAWYYATLALFHVGGPGWEAWNRSLQATLLPLQRQDGTPLAGSWDPDPVWGGHGGRVYATALTALTLEVYYRHLPLLRRSGEASTSLEARAVQPAPLR